MSYQTKQGKALLEYFRSQGSRHVSVQEIAAQCPKKVFDVEDGKLVAKRPLDCSLCGTCTENEGRGAITVNGDDTNFFFKFETDGSLTAKQVLDKAAEILSQDSKNFADLIAEL